MFVRLKRVRSYRYLQLVESVRAEDKPRQRVLATLGRVEQLQAEGSIDALVSSLSRFSPNALALITGESSPGTQALTIGPGFIFERPWQRLKLERILKELLRERCCLAALAGQCGGPAPPAAAKPAPPAPPGGSANRRIAGS